MWIVAFHIIFVITFMAGILYLPRLYVYHVQNINSPELINVFQIMEGKLIKFIINPSLILTIFFGSLLVLISDISIFYQIWFWIKLFALILMVFNYLFLIFCYYRLSNNHVDFSEKFYRLINEIPAILMVIIVIMVVIKPF